MATPRKQTRDGKIAAMDLPTLAAAVTSSSILSLAAARWLTVSLVNHRLSKDLEAHRAQIGRESAEFKATLDRSLAEATAEIQSRLRREVEEYLADRSAERQYALEARKRLYAAIGPLRFQLLTASTDFVSRTVPMAKKQQTFKITLDSYFGRSTVFRFLRLFAVMELIERQMAYADFAAEPSTTILLRFKYAAFKCMSSGRITLDHPNATWQNQEQHIFFDTLSMIAAAMIVSDGDRQRVMRFDEFNAFVAQPANRERIHPVPRLFEDFTTFGRPLLWLRIVALTALCNEYMRREGNGLGIREWRIDVVQLLSAGEDEFIYQHRARYRDAIEKLSNELASPSAG
jgi:hypothetical protein